MSGNQFALLKARRFLPLFVTQALGALNDNIFKNALTILLIFRIADVAGVNGQVLAAASAGVFILPFFLFSATAGQIADKFDKAAVIRRIKLAEVAVMTLGAIGLWIGNVTLLMSVLFLMGAQSAFFGPVKYSILPAHLKKDELISGNAFIEAGTFLSILAGTIAGGLMVSFDSGATVVAVTVVVLALLGFLSSLQIPQAAACSPDLRINSNILAETWSAVAKVRTQPDIFRTILGISWFWLVGATFLSLFPAMAKDVLSGDETLVTLLLALFVVGISIGSLLCNRLLKGEVTPKYVPFAAIGMTLFIADFCFAISGFTPSASGPIHAASFMESPGSLRILFDLGAIAVCGGLFIVPLYAILQHRSSDEDRSRVIAANNIVNALFMTVGAAAVTGLLAINEDIPLILTVVAVLNGIVAIYICKLLPDELIRALLKSLLKLFFRVEVRGLENYAKAGKRAVIVVNHVSFLDPLLLAVFLPVKPVFAVNTHIAKAWWLRPFLRLVDSFPIDPTNPTAAKSLIRAVQEDRHCVIFPEGRITVTGALMKVFEGPAMIADQSDAAIVPIRIDGAQYTRLSRLSDKVRIRLFPKITMTILEPMRFDLSDKAVGKTRRKLARAQLYDVMSDMVFRTCDHRKTLFSSLLDAADIHGRNHPILEDIARAPIDYGRLVLGSFVLGRKLASITKQGENVGLMVPNSTGAAVTFFALQAFGRVPAMLNFSTGLKNMLAALKTAEVKTVVTSRKFVEVAELEDTIDAFSKRVDIVYLEDVKSGISVFDKVRGLLARMLARVSHMRLDISPDDPAVVLFTSGSEGAPKGVVLSHANLLANCYQLGARIDFNAKDIVFNALPIFHSFGMTGGTLLPIISGVKTFLYPSPLHYRAVPALVYDSNATIMFGTDTFLTGYARAADPYDFFSVRYVFAGAERVKDETRRIWSEKFGIRIFEGYGTTETAPALCTNTPLHSKAGTVGRFLPGIAYTLQPVPGIEKGGRLIVRGPNVMLGYLKADNPGVLELAKGSSYDTGDIVDVDEEGFVTIQGRAKRFAKIGGEMVSLTAVEGYAAELWPQHQHAVVTVPDPRKGEQLVLITENSKASRHDLHMHFKTEGIADLMLPKVIIPVDAVPVLGTGKVDYVGVQQLATAPG